MENKELKKNALAFIESQHILTLATSEKDSPWAAAVYYIYYKNHFYFFSNPASQHIRESMKRAGSAVSIHHPSGGWSDIRGVQMKGRVQHSGIGKHLCPAFNKYLKKFNFISEIKKSVAVKDISAVETAFNVRFYRFIPEEIYYLDNSIKFGFREKIKQFE